MKDLSRLTERLGYIFTNPKYLQRALTHRSAANKHNERYEFLGDSILSAVISIALHQRFPDENEGQLSRLRAHLVKGDTLAQIALELHLGDFLFLGPGELKTGGYRRASILADALEAVFAAIFLDAGFDACQTVILALFHTRLSDTLASLNVKDPKTQLQEYLQALKYPLPEYTLLKSEENEAETIFHISCSISVLGLKTFGIGQTRRRAEQEAAQEILNLLQQKDFK